jgi:hemoglobin
MADAPTSLPALAGWAGGPQKLTELFQRFYAQVKQDALLAAVFAAMDPRHADQVTRFVGEVLGRPKAYAQNSGSHARVISRHLGRKLSQEQRRAWMILLLATADEIGLPDDPEFRASLVAYLEWGSRLAVLNSQEGVAEPTHAPLELVLTRRALSTMTPCFTCTTPEYVTPKRRDHNAHRKVPAPRGLRRRR